MHVHTCEDSFMLGLLRETTDMRLDDAVDGWSVCIMRFYSFLQHFHERHQFTESSATATASCETPSNGRSGWASPAAAKLCKATN